jgi:hypothetical protein
MRSLLLPLGQTNPYHCGAGRHRDLSGPATKEGMIASSALERGDVLFIDESSIPEVVEFLSAMKISHRFHLARVCQTTTAWRVYSGEPPQLGPCRPSRRFGIARTLTSTVEELSVVKRSASIPIGDVELKRSRRSATPRLQPPAR